MPGEKFEGGGDRPNPAAKQWEDMERTPGQGPDGQAKPEAADATKETPNKLEETVAGQSTGALIALATTTGVSPEVHQAVLAELKKRDALAGSENYKNAYASEPNYPELGQLIA